MALNKIKVNDTTTVNTGVVYDITKATGQSYDSLSAALGTDGNNVPPEVREGGMSIRFVLTSDNKYVQYRLTAQSFSTTVSDWQRQGAEVTVSQNVDTEHININIGDNTTHVASAQEIDSVKDIIYHPEEITDTQSLGAATYVNVATRKLTIGESSLYYEVAYPVVARVQYHYHLIASIPTSIAVVTFFDSLPSIGDSGEVIEAGRRSNYNEEYDGYYIPSTNGYITIQHRNAQTYPVSLTIPDTSKPKDITDSFVINVNSINNKLDAAYASTTDARNEVPTKIRRQGLLITYLLSDGWHTEQFIGSDISGWTTVTNWKRINVKITATESNGKITITVNGAILGVFAKGNVIDAVNTLINAVFESTPATKDVEVSQNISESWVDIKGEFKNVSQTPANPYNVNVYPVSAGVEYSYSLRSAVSKRVALLSFYDHLPAVNDVAVWFVYGISEWEYFTGTYTPVSDGYILVQQRSLDETVPVKISYSTVELVPKLNKYESIEDLGKVIKNEERLWMNKVVLTYKKPNTTVDNISNFDNLMSACIYAKNHANINNQYEIQVYEDIYVNDISQYEAITGFSSLYAIIWVTEYVKVRGMGTPTVIYGEINPQNFAGHKREEYEVCHFDGGEMENIVLKSYNIRYAVHFERAGSTTNQNIKSHLVNCTFQNLGGLNEAIGAETSAYRACDAWGMGSSQGLAIVFDGCTFIGARHGFRCHTAPSHIYVFPTRYEFNNCHFVGLGNFAMFLDDYGSEQINQYILNGCSLQGYIGYIADTDMSDTIPFGISIKGHDNVGFTYYFRQSKALRLVANVTGNTIEVLTDDANIFGYVKYRRGDYGLQAIAYGTKNITTTSHLLGKRIGNCSTTNKVLSFKIGSTTFTKTFATDYTNMSNSDIIAELNAISGLTGIFDEYNFNSEYYPEFTDIVFNKRNSTNAVITKGAYVKKDGTFNVIVSTESEADYIALSDVGIGQMGKFRKK